MVEDHLLQFENPNFVTNNIVGNINGAGGSCWNSHSGIFRFYFDSWNVLDANFNTMPNGNIINAPMSGNGSNLVIPMLSDSNKFFLFCLAYHSNSTPYLGYSVIDLTLNSGLGDVISSQKNVELFDKEPKNFAATAHRDGQHAWVVTRIGLGHELHISLVGDTIISTHLDTLPSPILPGPQLTKFSPNGKYLASLNGSNKIDVFLFDNLTGSIQQFLSFEFDQSVTSLCFSSESNILYAREAIDNFEGKLVQIELNSGSRDSITLMGANSIGMSLTRYGSLIFNRSLNNLGLIEYPNEFEIGYNFIDSFFVSTASTVASVPPNFVSNWTNRMFDVEQACFPDSAQFYYAGYRMDSAVWDFGEPSSGSFNIGHGQEVKHMYADTGTYTVTLYATTGMQCDTIVQQVHISMPIQANPILEDSVVFCANDSVQLNINSPQTMSYNWSSGDSTSQIFVSDSGQYFVTMINQCGVVIDSVLTILNDTITLQPLTDTTLCFGDTLSLNATANTAATWLWSNGDSTSQTQVSENGSNEIEIWVEASNACGAVRDSAIINVLSQPDVSWFSDSILCDQNSTVITQPNTFGVSYIMRKTTDSVVDDTINPWLVDTFGLYYLTAFNICDSVTKRAFLSPFQIIEKDIQPNFALCPGEEVVLEAFWPGSTYLWNESVESEKRNDSAVVVSAPLNHQLETQVYTVSITNPPCSKVLSTTIEYLSEDSCGNACKFSLPNVITPNHDGKNDLLHIENTCSSLDYRFAIYNRWGQLMHVGNQSIASWDGSANGQLVSNGVYFIVIEYIDFSGKEKTVNGSFEVISE